MKAALSAETVVYTAGLARDTGLMQFFGMRTRELSAKQRFRLIPAAKV